MPTLTVRNLEEDLVKRLRLRDALPGPAQPPGGAEVAARLAAFRQRVAGRGGPDAAALLRKARGGGGGPGLAPGPGLAARSLACGFEAGGPGSNT